MKKRRFRAKNCTILNTTGRHEIDLSDLYKDMDSLFRTDTDDDNSDPDDLPF